VPRRRRRVPAAVSAGVINRNQQGRPRCLRCAPITGYTGGVEANWIEATVGENGQLVLTGVPFAPGESVDVLIVSKHPSPKPAGRSLLGSVIEYRNPFAPVAEEDWDALR